MRLSAFLYRQRGEMLISRMVLLIAILLAMLVVPLYLWKSDDNKKKATEAAERARNAPAAAPAAANDARRNNPDRFGLTFGWNPAPAADRLHASCHGQPKDTITQPHNGSCNPYQGDTSCRIELPVLCTRPAEGGLPLQLAATRYGVAGFLLTAPSDGDARCVAEFGPGWRMSTFHDAGGWELPGQRAGAATINTDLRAWIAIGDQRGNCWDPVS